MTCFAVSVAVSGCPGLLNQVPVTKQQVTGTQPANPTQTTTQQQATTLQTVVLSPLQALVPISLAQPILGAEQGLTGAAGLTSVAPLTQAAAYRAAYRRIQDATSSDFAEAPVPNSVVIALSTTGGQQVVGNTDANGQVNLKLDVDKVYYITAPFVDALGAYREFRTVIKVRKQDKDAPPPQTCNFASTVVTTALTNSNGGDFHNLKQIDVNQVKQAVDTTQAIIKKQPKLLATVILTTNAADPTSVTKALKTLNVAKLQDPTLAALPAPTDIVAQAAASKDTTNSLDASGATKSVTVSVTAGQDANQIAKQQQAAATPAPTPVPTQAPTAAPTATPAPIHVSTFDFAPGMPTQVFIPLISAAGLPVFDPAYPRAAILTTNTVLTDGSTIPIASWSIAAGGQGGKISVDSGILKIDPSSSPGLVNILAQPVLDFNLFQRIQPIQLLATPLRISSASVQLPTSFPGLTVPADLTVPGDNNLGKATSVKLATHLLWNDQHQSDLATDLASASSLLTWTTSTPNLVSIDQDGTVHALPNTTGGTAVVTVTAGWPVAPTNTLVATPSATLQIPITRSSQTTITIQ